MKLKILDLFCGAGGASAGYYATGFDVTGVDIAPQSRYPFKFIEADVMKLPKDFLRQFDVIHASPPCQGYTSMRFAPGAHGTAPRLISQVREMLLETWLPYVIENVEDARSEMIDPLTLCGSMFHLEAQGCWLQRHRLFESNIPLRAPNGCRHDEHRPVIGVYGGHARKRSAKHGGRGFQDVWIGGHAAAAAQAMEINWMTLAEISEAIPPVYAVWIGELFKIHINNLMAA